MRLLLSFGCLVMPQKLHDRSDNNEPRLRCADLAAENNKGLATAASKLPAVAVPKLLYRYESSAPLALKSKGIELTVINVPKIIAAAMSLRFK